MMGERRFGRWWAGIDRYPTVTDTVVAGVLAVFGASWFWLDPPPPPTPAPPVVAACVLLQCLPLGWRRRFPAAVLLVVTLGTILFGLVSGAEFPWTATPWLLAAYSAGAYAEDRWRDRARGLAATAFAGYVAFAVFRQLPAADPGEPTWRLELFQVFTLVRNAAIVVWVWWFGDSTRLRRAQADQLAERTRQLERERAANARLAVIDERVRIARELHDVVAHHVSLMGLQAGAARLVLDRWPEKVGETLSAIEASSREAVREMQRLLGFLRQDRDDDPLAPRAGMGQIETLIDQMRAAGLAVTLEVAGAARPLPPSIDLSAYRIVQEALTNTLKHAGPTAATVGVRYGERAFELEITDEGGAAVGVAVAAAGDGGNGLLGMRERVGLLGGELEVGRRPQGGGFAVRVRLPLDGGRR